MLAFLAAILATNCFILATTISIRRKLNMLDLAGLQPHLDALTAAIAALAALPIPSPAPAPDLQPVADIVDAATTAINARIAAGG